MMLLTKGRTPVLCLGLTLVVLAAYANHFQNRFHFDDAPTVVENRFVRDLRNIPSFFTDSAKFSINPAGQVYRPVVTTSLALDYRLARNEYKPFAFHLSTFLWYCVEVILLFFFFRRIMDAVDPHPTNLWVAWLAAACYGLHPANAETVNYIIQRGDVYTTLGVVASLLVFAAFHGVHFHLVAIPGLDVDIPVSVFKRDLAGLIERILLVDFFAQFLAGIGGRSGQHHRER